MSGGIIRDGKKEGLWKIFYDDGKLKHEIFYKNDMKEGMFRSYYSSGALRVDTNYKNDELDGSWTE